MDLKIDNSDANTRSRNDMILLPGDLNTKRSGYMNTRERTQIYELQTLYHTFPSTRTLLISYEYQFELFLLTNI